MIDITSRDEARSEIKRAGITVENVTKEQLSILWDCIYLKMLESDNYRGTFRMDKKVSLFMTCSTDQWKKREAISFNRDGFIGMAGWADNSNIIPVLDGVECWLNQLK